jgi:hypothetical protein
MSKLSIKELITDNVLIKSEPEFTEYVIDPRFNLFIFDGEDNIEIKIQVVQVYNDETIVVIDKHNNIYEIVESELMLTLKV